MTVIFIADACSNHQSDLEHCLAFVDRAAEVGCAAVNFQLFKVDPLISSEARGLRAEFVPRVAARCRERGILFGGAPRHLEALAAFLPFADFFNIGPHELEGKDLLAGCGRTGKPVVLATGMAALKALSEAVAVLRTSGSNDLALLHCASVDRVPLKGCNLAHIETLREQFACPVGWSDHSVQPAVLYRAVHAWSADLVKFGLDPDGMDAECSAKHCWRAEQIAPVIRACNEGFRADGSAIKSASREDSVASAIEAA